MTVLVLEGDETFELSSEKEAVLLAAIGAADRGETTRAADLMKQIRLKLSHTNGQGFLWRS